MYLHWIVVKDIKAAIAFYTKIIGLQLKTYDEKYGWAELSGPEGSLLGIAQENEHQEIKAGSNAVITITVDDIISSRNELAKKSVRLLGDIIEVPEEVKMQTFVDPDGNMMQLVQMLRKEK